MATHVKFFNAQLRDIPIIGDDLSQIGRTIDILATPCNISAEIWVTALFHAAPTLIWSLAKPEIVDTDIGHRGRRSKKGRKLRFYASQVFQFEMHQIKLPRTVAMTINEAAQRIGWYLMIADATTDFAINWTSMAYQWGGCPGLSPTPNFKASVAQADPNITSAEGWTTIGNLGFTDLERVQALSVPTRARPMDACLPMFSLRAATRPFVTNGGYVYAWRVINTVTGEVIGELESEGDGSNGNLTSGTFFAGQEADPTAEFALQVYKSAGFATTTEPLDWRMNSTLPLAPLSLLPDP